MIGPSTSPEESILGSIINDDSLARVAIEEGLAAQHFERPAHRTIYATMESMARRGDRIDAITLFNELQGKIDQPATDLAILDQNHVTDVFFREHMALVRERAVERERRAFGRRLAGGKGTSDELRAIEAGVRRADERPPVVPLFVGDALAALAAEPPLVPVPTGIVGLDKLLDGGLRAKRLHVLCGPPGTGKTALVGELTRRLVPAIRPVAPVLVCSTEIEPDEQAARIVAPLLDASPDSLLRHEADLARAVDLAHGWPVALLNLDLDSDSEVDPLALIAAHVEAVAARAGARPVVIVDYLQDLVSMDPETRRLGVSSMARRLRQLARVRNVAVFACSSVSRAHYGDRPKTAGDNAEDPRAWLAAAKESGDVEFAAAVLMFLDVAPAVGHVGERAARLIVAKARTGSVGFVGLRFDGRRGAFREDGDALRELGSTARMHSEVQRVLDAIRDTRDAPQPWRDLRDVVGGKRARVDAAYRELRASKRVTERRIVDDTGASRVRRAWVILPEWASDPLPEGAYDVGSEPRVRPTQGAQRGAGARSSRQRDARTPRASPIGGRGGARTATQSGDDAPQPIERAP